MIRGFFSNKGGRLRPFIDATFQFPTLGDQRFSIQLLVDTGADRTILAPLDALRLELETGISLAALSAGSPSIGVGGQVTTRSIAAIITFDSFALEIPLTVLDVPSGPIPAIPSLLGRNVIAHFALFLEERTGRVFLLEPAEASALIFT